MADAPSDDDRDSIAIDTDALEMDAEESILAFASELESVDYLSLLRLPRPDSADAGPAEDEIRDAFHGFANAFHPDRHRGAPVDVADAAAQVYRRGAEAYRVLQDPMLRRRYYRLLIEQGATRMPPDEIAQSKHVERGVRESIASMVRSAAAEAFARRADELLEKGDVKQARLQLQLALMREPQNARLQERMKTLEEQIARSGPSSGR